MSVRPLSMSECIQAMRAEVWWRGPDYDEPWGCRPFGADMTHYGRGPAEAVRRAFAWFEQCVKDEEGVPNGR